MGNKFDYNRYSTGNFLFPSHIGRMEYIARNIGLTVISLPMKLIAEKSENLFVLLLCLVLLITICIAGLWISIIPRIRDIGWNPKLAWLMLIPGVNIIFGISLAATP
jgi:hypothetical protein